MATTLYPNLARDTAVRDEIDTLVALMKRTRQQRRTLDQTWLRYYRIWSAERDVQAYRGRSQIYIPTGRRIIENWVQKLKRDLFSTDEWFDVMALRESFEDRRNAIKALFRYFLSKQMRLRRKVTPMLRQLVTFGTAPIAIAWKLDQDRLPVLHDMLDESGNLTGKTEDVIETVTRYVGPTFRNVDLFAWFVAPVTVSDLNEANLIFEELLVSRERVQELAKQSIGPDADMGNVFENVEEALALNPQGDLSDKFQSEQQRLQTKGFSGRVDPKDPNRPLDISEVYWKTNLAGQGLEWWRITLAGDRVPLRVQKNPFWHGNPPWLCGKFVEVVNEFYGRGLPETFDKMQYFLNDIGDQGNDALVWSMNPIAIVDAYKVQDLSSIRMRPGAKWLASTDAVTFAEPPKDTPTVAFNAVSQFIGLMNDVSNVAAFAGIGTAGPRSRGRALQTAAGAQIVLSENLVQIRDVLENIEDQVFVPMLRMMHMLTQQCLSAPLILRIAGADGASLVEHKFTAADVVGDFDFEWLGSTSTMNQQVRGQQMINFLQIVAKVPPQLLAANNMQVDYGYLMRSIWSDGLGLRNGERVIKDIQRIRTMDPRVEDDLVLVGRGEEIAVSQGDNDDYHLKIHDQFLANPKLDAYAKNQLMLHMQEHIASKLAKQMMQAQQQAQQQLQNGNGAPNGTQAPAMGGQNPTLNPGRPAQTNSMDDLFRSLPRGGTA